MPRTPKAKTPVEHFTAKLGFEAQIRLAALNRTTLKLNDRIFANLHQSRTLATLRDTLLPKLLSGELPYSQIEPFQS